MARPERRDPPGRQPLQLWSVAVVDVVVAYHADLDLARQVVHDVAGRARGDEDVAGDVLARPRCSASSRVRRTA